MSAPDPVFSWPKLLVLCFALFICAEGLSEAIVSISWGGTP